MSRIDATLSRPRNFKKHVTGFTLVEMLVVITIVGIIASLTVVVWSGWQRRAAETEVKSDLTAVVTAMKSEQNFSNGFPTSIPSSFKASPGVTLTYASGDASSYCIDGSSKNRPNVILFVRQDGAIKKGTCLGGEIADYPAEGALVATATTTGLNSSCALSQGRPYCWGNNGQGQLGNNSTTNSNKPVAVNMSGVLSGKTVTQVSTGYSHSCAIADGAAYCWGLNSQGQLGNNSTANSSVPVAVNTSGLLSGKTITSIVAGGYFTCAVADGLVYCWGQNNYGQLGNNSTTNSLLPVAVTTTGVLSGRTVSMIDAAVDNVCVVASGNAYCWGANFYGKLGNNSTTNSSVPVAVVTSGVLNGKTITAIDGALTFMCAIANGAPYCWGWNNYGQLGDGTTTSSNVPVAVITSGVLSGKMITQVAASVNAACVIGSGSAYCWGRGDNGELGNNTFVDSLPAVAVNTSGALNGKTLTSIAGGSNYFCAISSPDVFCWGINNWGQLGNSSSTSSSVPVRVSNP